jgi:DNA-binding beta-propeller fold protein YncE
VSCAGSAQTTEPTAATIAATSQPLTLVWQSEFTRDARLISPSDVVVDEQGNTYISTQSSKNIKKFDSEGKLVTHWGDYGSGEGQFSLTAGIALDAQGNVYVADFNNARIQKFDSTGKFLLKWATKCNGQRKAISIEREFLRWTGRAIFTSLRTRMPLPQPVRRPTSGS